MKKVLVGSSALALVLTAGFFAATTVGSAPKARVAPATTTSTSTRPAPRIVTTTTTTVAPTTTTSPTVKPKPVDPVLGAVALRVQGQSIDAIDADGRVVKHLVTAFADRSVVAAHLLGDHHTIWYETMPAPNSHGPDSCGDVVRLDLASNQRTVIAHADSFAVSGDGARVALENVQADANCVNGANQSDGRNVVRDLNTGKESKIVGELTGELVLSPGGHVLATTECNGEYGDCELNLATAAVPDTIGAPVTMHTVNDDELGLFHLAGSNDGLYANVEEMSSGSPANGQQVVRRFSWNDLGGAGTPLFTTDGAHFIDAIAPTSNGVYAIQSRESDSQVTLDRLRSSGAVGVQVLPTDPETFLGTIDPFFG